MDVLWVSGRCVGIWTMFTVFKSCLDIVWKVSLCLDSVREVFLGHKKYDIQQLPGKNSVCKIKYHPMSNTMLDKVLVVQY